MRRHIALLVCGVLWAAVLPAAGGAPDDRERGRALFAEKQCSHCHKHRGVQALGPPLEELRRRQGVLELAGRLWNHAPAMFGVLEYEGIQWPHLRAEEMADLMAYLQADPSLDPAPDLPAGQLILVRKGCLKCHRFRGEGGAVGIELTTYHGGFEFPVVWASTIWNHSPMMAEDAVGLGILYPRFTGEEMANLFGFLKSAAVTHQHP